MVFSIGITGPFSMVNQCTGILQPTASCAIQIIFLPLDIGAQSGMLTVTSNAAGSPTAVPLSGNGWDVRLVLMRPARPSRSGSGAIAQLEISIAGSAANAMASVSCDAAPFSCSATPAVLRVSGSPTRMSIFVDPLRRSARLKTSAFGVARVRVTVGGVVRTVDVPFAR
jgi:hypothetical protein